MRLVYTADLHGDIQSYQALLDLAASSGARAVIVGGDLLPHAIKIDGAVRLQRDFIEQMLRPLLASFHAQHPSVAVYLLAGNDDWAAAISVLEDLQRDALAFPLHGRVYRLIDSNRSQSRTVGHGAAAEPAPLWLAGYACVPLTPFSIKDYERRDDGPLPSFSFKMAYVSGSGAIKPISVGEFIARPSIAEDLAALAAQSDPARTIYVCHTPPANTPLDLMPRERHAGSKALRAFIERYQPPLTLHGHIHEAPQLSGQYAVRLGPSWCVNPGHDQRRFHAVTLDTDNIGATITHTVFGGL